MGMNHIELDVLKRILERIGQIRVGVLGDFCVDIYWHADMRLSELSRETPHFPLPVVRERFSLGAGGNVAANAAALSPAKVVAVGVVGRDWRGDVLTKELDRWGMDSSNIIEDADRVTFAYCKPMRKGVSDVEYEDPRLDFINYEPIGVQTEERLIEAIRSLPKSVDVLLVSDQFLHGCVTERIRGAISALAQSGLTVVVDSRHHIGLFSGAILKPNEIEGKKALGIDPAQTSDDEACAAALAQKTDCRVLMTLGEQGSIYADGKTLQRFSPWVVRNPVDIVGAGDTFLSGFSCALAAGAAVGEAADFAGLCSAVTISKIGITGTATPEELIAKYAQLMREDS